MVKRSALLFVVPPSEAVGLSAKPADKRDGEKFCERGSADSLAVAGGLAGMGAAGGHRALCDRGGGRGGFAQCAGERAGIRECAVSAEHVGGGVDLLLLAGDS